MGDPFDRAQIREETSVIGSGVKKCFFFSPKEKGRRLSRHFRRPQGAGGGSALLTADPKCDLVDKIDFGELEEKCGVKKRGASGEEMY